MKYILLFSLLFCCFIFPADAEEREPNYDESKIDPYTLPDPLVCEDGTKVTTPDQWYNKRRGEILNLFASQMYGAVPGCDSSKLAWEILRTNPVALNGKATFKEIRIWFDAPNPAPKLDILLCLPNDAEKPIPAFLGFNFKGNHSISDDPWISIPDPPAGKDPGQFKPEERGIKKGRWPIEMILGRGYALVTGYYEDVDPDFDDHRQNGVHPLFAPYEKDVPEESRAATISAWAWGLSRVLDVLEEIPEIDAGRTALLGHSRLGKTALWAGANDTRFALVISNDSGCGGAALSRRNFGETTWRMMHVFPHWLTPSYARYIDRPADAPFDQHELIALIAPRPVYIASAEEDLWADPKGEFLSAWNADPVYRLLGTEGIGGIGNTLPETDHPVGAVIHYHRRSGIHDVTSFDWTEYLNFADTYLKTSKAETNE